MTVDYVEDPYQHIVAIKLEVAAGAVCVFGDRNNPFGASGRIYVGVPDGRAQSWQVAYPSLPARVVMVAAYALIQNPALPGPIPTFLMGSEGHDLYHSYDGVRWSVVATTGGNVRSGWCGFVWHPEHRLFYALWDTISEAPLNTIYSSTDGVSWSAGPSFDDHNEANDAFRALCTKPQNRGGIPDGYQGYNPATKTFIKPTFITGWNTGTPTWDNDPRFSGITIEREGGGDPLPPADGGGPAPTGVWSVTFSGGVWNLLVAFNAANITQIWISTDDAQTWRQTFATDHAAVFHTIASGTASDIATYLAEHPPA